MSKFKLKVLLNLGRLKLLYLNISCYKLKISSYLIVLGEICLNFLEKKAITN
jgi:hypothetical protein